jgi:hypothetical protein
MLSPRAFMKGVSAGSLSSDKFGVGNATIIVDGYYATAPSIQLKGRDSTLYDIGSVLEGSGMIVVGVGLLHYENAHARRHELILFDPHSNTLQRKTFAPAKQQLSKGRASVDELMRASARFAEFEQRLAEEKVAADAKKAVADAKKATTAARHAAAAQVRTHAHRHTGAPSIA